MRKLDRDEIVSMSSDGNADIRHPIVVLLDGVRSIYNVGSIIRSSDAFAIEHVYLAGITGTPEHHAMRKTSLGAEEHVPWTKVADAGATALELRERGYKIAALEITDRARPLDDVSPDDFPLCLIVGNEVDGVSNALLELCDTSFRIEQFGAKQSLNVAVAFGVAASRFVEAYRLFASAGE